MLVVGPIAPQAFPGRRGRGARVKNRLSAQVHGQLLTRIQRSAQTGMRRVTRGVDHPRKQHAVACVQASDRLRRKRGIQTNHGRILPILKESRWHGA